MRRRGHTAPRDPDSVGLGARTCSPHSPRPIRWWEVLTLPSEAQWGPALPCPTQGPESGHWTALYLGLGASDPCPSPRGHLAPGCLHGAWPRAGDMSLLL